MGMSRSDFCACTPSEFAAAVKSWRETEESRRRDAWERMRLLALMTVQPHVKQRLSPSKLMPLPWDGEAKAAVPERGAAPCTAEESRRRLAALLEARRRQSSESPSSSLSSSPSL